MDTSLILIDLAGAKSEALDNIYSLLKQNIKSCNVMRRRQGRRMVKNNSTCSCSLFFHCRLFSPCIGGR